MGKQFLRIFIKHANQCIHEIKIESRLGMYMMNCGTRMFHQKWVISSRKMIQNMLPTREKL